MNWEEIWPKIQDFGAKYGPPFLWAIVTLVLGWIAAKIVRAILKKAMRKAKMDETLIGFFANLVYMLILAFVVIAALGRVGVQTGSFVAIVGAAGLAIGFALQGSLANFAAGVMIILFRPFRLGDYIEGGGAAGSVEEILIFSTMLKTPDNKKIIVPNSSLMSGNIVNYSAKDIRRVDMTFGIGYGDDIREAKQVLEGLVTNHELVLKDPAPQVVVGELADSSVNFHVRPWVKTADYWTVYFDITEAVKLTFDSKGISIPFPQQDVHMHQVA
jgi:small conductance mechanosensitive channel